MISSLPEKKLVSVIIPVYNREEFIKKCLLSIYLQEHRPIELIIVDDGSTDDSLQILYDFKAKNESEDFEIKIFTQENKGAPVARNKGLKEATGEYIQFLDSDDYLDSRKISEQLNELLIKKSKVAICDFCYVNGQGIVMKQIKNTGNLLFKLAKGGSLFTPTPLFHKSLYEKGLIWEESLKRNQDIDFIFKLLLLSKKYIYTEGYWCHYVIHNKDQISNSYKTTAPEFRKRIISLVKFGVTKINLISVKKIFYLLLGVAALYRQWIIYNYKKTSCFSINNDFLV